MKKKDSNQKALPKSTMVLVMALLSHLSFLCCILTFGIMPFILSLVTLNMAATAKETYEDYEGVYSKKSMTMVTIGKVIAWFALLSSLLWMIGTGIWIWKAGGLMVWAQSLLGLVS